MLHQFSSSLQLNSHIRISKRRDLKIQYDSLDEQNRTLYSAECSIEIREHLLSILADSFLYVPERHDSTKIYHNEIMTYSLKLVRNGSYVAYFPNGSTRITGQFMFDRKHGEWTYYNKEGKIVKTETWNNSLLIKQEIK